MKKILQILLFVLVGLSTSAHAQNIELEVKAWEENPDKGYVSCPWIYCWNGSDYVADNDVYSTARGANREYTDYYKLQRPLVEKNGEYLLELRENRDEHSFTDMIKLMVVDHQSGVRIGSDEAGNIRAYTDPLPPISAVLNGNFNVIEEVTMEDGKGASVYHQDTIVVDFGLLDVSQGALLVMRAIGFMVDDIQDLGDNTYQQPTLQIQTLNSLGDWETRSTFYPRDDWATGCFNLTGLLSDSDGNIKVRIFVTSCHTKKYHILDYIGLETSPQDPIIVSALSPKIALHSNGTSVLSDLVTSDGVYAGMMPGQKISMTFSIPTMFGEQRDFIFICKGYYQPMSIGTYYIQTWNEVGWDTVYSASFITSSDYVDTTQFFDMSSFLPDTDGDYKVRISQSYTRSYAGIDFVGLTKDGVVGNMVSALDLGKGWSVFDTVSVSDDIRDEWGWEYGVYDTANIRTIEIEWDCEDSYAKIEEGSFEFEGKVRNYAVFLPHNFKPDMPVVFALPGWEDSPEWTMNYIGMNSVADTMGFVVVYPAAIWPGFNSGCIRPSDRVQAANVNDVGFISNLIDTIYTKYGIDLKRVYCCGLSNGGNMAHKIASQIGYRFAAVADVLGAMNDRIANDYYKIRSLPILICHGTADILCPYNGDPSRQQWSIEETVNFWVQNNGCVLEADTVSLPDIDTLDGCTIDKISYRNCEDSTVVIFYKGIDMGHSWPGSASTFPSEGNINRDINANVEVLNFFKNYENPLANLAYGKSFEVSHIHYFPPQGDTLIINAQLVNPANHPLTVYTLIIGDEHGLQDSINLFDNGLHSDGDAFDNSWGEAKWLSGLPEDFFTVEVHINDLTDNVSTFIDSKVQFTTAGPLKLDSVSYTKNDNRQYYNLKPFVRNDGKSMTVKYAKIRLYCDDPWVESVTTGNSLPDIDPGTIVSSNLSTTFFYIDSLLPEPVYFNLRAEIEVNGRVYWTDSMTIGEIQTGVEEISTPIKFMLGQNYPNPFNPSTTIEYSIPTQSKVIIKIYDILGKEVKTLVNEENQAGYYEVQFDGTDLSSGIYFYQLKSGNFVETKKMLLLK